MSRESPTIALYLKPVRFKDNVRRWKRRRKKAQERRFARSPR